MPDFHIKKLKYDIDEILRRFDLRVSMHCTILDEWLSVAIPLGLYIASTVATKTTTFINRRNDVERRGAKNALFVLDI
jgi:hypothetical protein